jgi:transcriptional regulator with XRE-family HTH domain
MSMQDLLDKIEQRAAARPEHSVPPPVELVGFVVRWERSLRNWKASTLAGFAGVSLSTLERVERGEKVSDALLDKIAQGLGYAAGHFTRPRLPKSCEDALADFTDTYGHLEIVPVSPMGTQRAIRELARTYAVLFHRPGVPDTYNGEIANLRDWLDVSNSILQNAEEESSPGRGRRDLYNDIIGCVRDLERRGLTLLSGVMHAPQKGFLDWKVGIVSATLKSTDPGAAKRKQILVDRRVVALPSGWTDDGEQA